MIFFTISINIFILQQESGCDLCHKILYLPMYGFLLKDWKWFLCGEILKESRWRTIFEKGISMIPSTVNARISAQLQISTPPKAQNLYISAPFNPSTLRGSLLTSQIIWR